MKVIGFGSGKGGVGKTVVSGQCAARVAAGGLRVATLEACVIPRLAAYLRRPELSLASSYHAGNALHLPGNVTDPTCLFFEEEWMQKRLHNVPGSQLTTFGRRNYRRLELLYDVVFADLPTHPRIFGALTLEFATDVVIPLTPEPDSVAGLPAFLQRCKASNASSISIVFTNVSRTKLHYKCMAELRKDDLVAPYIIEPTLGKRSDFAAFDRKGRLTKAKLEMDAVFAALSSKWGIV